MAWHQTGGAELQRLIQLLSRLPGLGPRSARRAALALLQEPAQRLRPLADALDAAEASIRTCAICGTLDVTDPCVICRDEGRDHRTLCVVEQVSDLWALERAMIHHGVYIVLGGTLSALQGKGPDDLNTDTLFKRAQAGDLDEVILALGATVEGAATSHYLEDRLALYPVTVTRVGRGVPMGGSLDGLDDGTLVAALMARRPVSGDNSS